MCILLEALGPVLSPGFESRIFGRFQDSLISELILSESAHEINIKYPFSYLFYPIHTHLCGGILIRSGRLMRSSDGWICRWKIWFETWL